MFSSTLINGKGRYPSGPDVPLAFVNVQQGKRSVLPLISLVRIFEMYCYNSYRFRLLSISCDPSFVFSIDNHQMTVIEVEGINVQPLIVDSLEIFAGVHSLTSLSCCTH
jgi:iron transport multicopper oxidase